MPPRPTFRVGSAAARPGEIVSVPIANEFEGGEMVGWGGILLWDAGTLTVQSVGATRAAHLVSAQRPRGAGAAGSLEVSVIYSFIDLFRYLTPAESGTIALVELCVHPDAQPGSYEISYAQRNISTSPRLPPLHATLMTPTAGEEIVYADVIAGIVEVSGEPATSNGCPDPFAPPPALQAAFRLGGPESARVGEIVTLSFTAEANRRSSASTPPSGSIATYSNSRG